MKNSNSAETPIAGMPSTPSGWQRHEPVAGAEKRHLSATQINMYLRCPRQYEYRYIRGLKVPPSGAMVQGRVWHQAVEKNYRQKINSDSDLPLGEMQDFFAAQFDTALAAEEIAFERNEKPGPLMDQGVAIVAAHHREIAPAVHPLLVEERFTMDLGEDFPFTLDGVWDLIERDGTIADNKSKNRTPSQEDLDRDIQFTIYSMASRATRGVIEPGLRMDAVVKTKIPKAVQLHTRRTNEDCQWLLRLIEEVGKAIDSGVFFPNPNGWHCSKNFCGYYGRCKRGA